MMHNSPGMVVPRVADRVREMPQYTFSHGHIYMRQQIYRKFHCGVKNKPVRRQTSARWIP